jgi:hypothetical protein
VSSPGRWFTRSPGTGHRRKGWGPLFNTWCLSRQLILFYREKSSRPNLRKSNRLPARFLTVHFKTYEFWRGTPGTLRKSHCDTRERETVENTDQVETRKRLDVSGHLRRKTQKNPVFRANLNHLDPEFHSWAGSACRFVRDGSENAHVVATPALAPFGEAGLAGVEAWGER